MLLLTGCSISKCRRMPSKKQTMMRSTIFKGVVYTAKERNEILSFIMESHVFKQLQMQVDSQVDLHQFGYKSKRGLDATSSLLIHSVAEHQTILRHHSRFLFVDFRSVYKLKYNETFASWLTSCNCMWTPLCLGGLSTIWDRGHWRWSEWHPLCSNHLHWCSKSLSLITVAPHHTHVHWYPPQRWEQYHLKIYRWFSVSLAVATKIWKLLFAGIWGIRRYMYVWGWWSQPEGVNSRPMNIDLSQFSNGCHPSKWTMQLKE